MNTRLSLVALMLALCGAALAAEDRSPIGPVILEMTDQTTVKGLLLDINDNVLVVRTSQGDKTYERKKVKKLDTVAGKEAAGVLAGLDKKNAPPAAVAAAPVVPPVTQPVAPATPVPSKGNV